MKRSCSRLVRDFCQAWSRLDPDELAAYFTEGAVYHDILLAPIKGREAIRKAFKGYANSLKGVEFEILHQVAGGNIVMHERIDRMLYDDRTAVVPAAGVFEIEGGKIKAWRDYFDLGMAR